MYAHAHGPTCTTHVSVIQATIFEIFKNHLNSCCIVDYILIINFVSLLCNDETY